LANKFLIVSSAKARIIIIRKERTYDMDDVSSSPPNPNILVPRGPKVKLPHGGLPEIFSPHLAKLITATGGVDGPIGRQFVARPEEEKEYYLIRQSDRLNEDEYEEAPGLVYKYRGKLKENGEVEYYGRALWTVTRFCASYCRFCTRGREVGLMEKPPEGTKATIAHKAFLSKEDIAAVRAYIIDHKEINEIIVSGGDPLTAPQDYLTEIIGMLSELQRQGHLDIIRVGTRLPVHNPIAIKDWHFQLLSTIRNPYLMVHINHPAELTPETLAVLQRFRRDCLANVMSQTVLLKGVNDSVETLYTLFTNIAKEGIRPYYIFNNDEPYWAVHFTVPPARAIAIWKQLRPRLSGVAATARFVIDVPNGKGKVPIPEGDAWDLDYTTYRDFTGKTYKFE
jgi:lysine 2,3-aminomutase